MIAETLALRAPDYMKIVASLIAAHGWCGDASDPIAGDGPAGLNLTRAAMWAVGGQGCHPRDLTDAQAEMLAEVLDHLEADRGLGRSVDEYERATAGTRGDLVAWEIAIAAWRYETDLAAVG